MQSWTKLLILMVVLLNAACTAVPEPAAFSGTVLLNKERIHSLNANMHQLVDKHDYAGAITLVLQHGKTLSVDAYGYADAQRGVVMRPDSIMAIASMTKPVTGVAMMMLYEQGLWSLDDPVAKYVPEFANLKVLTADVQLVRPDHMPTLRELMSHNAGFTYGMFGDSPVDRLYQAVQPLDKQTSLQTMIDKVARLPLKHQPGSVWEYSLSVDIQGYIVERLSGMPYDVFIRKKILEPLRMRDTDFAVRGDARERLAFPHAVDAQGKQVVVLPEGGRESHASVIPGLPSPGGALFSTAGDYARFAQMLLNGGVLDGVRLLKPETVLLMQSNVLPEGVFASLDTQRYAFGLDVAIALDPAQSGALLPRGSYFWLGSYGTYFWVDPANDMVVVGMVQRATSLNWRPDLMTRARNVAVTSLYGSTH